MREGKRTCLKDRCVTGRSGSVAHRSGGRKTVGVILAKHPIDVIQVGLFHNSAQDTLIFVANGKRGSYISQCQKGGLIFKYQRSTLFFSFSSCPLG